MTNANNSTFNICIFFRYGRQCEKEKLDSEPISCEGVGDAENPDKAPEKCPSSINK